MNPLFRHFADLRFALQELESAVQQPREEPHAVEEVLYEFPAVISRLVQVLSEALSQAGHETETLEEMFRRAHELGWLKGDLGLWLHLVSEYEHLGEIDAHTPRGISLAQHIRGCASMLWQTYELVMQRFRSQTQVPRIRTPRSAPQIQVVSLGAKATA